MSKNEVSEIQLEGLVVLKIIKQCKESFPSIGQLLGLDMGNVLQVTNCYPFPIVNDESSSEKEREDADAYRTDMLKCLREVNVDNNVVGWYKSTLLESFMDTSMIRSQFEYQSQFGKRCVCLIYDPWKTSQGNICIKALRLTDNFMELFKNSQHITQESLAKYAVSSRDIFEELPIRLHNTLLAEALLFDLEENKELRLQDCEFSSLDLSTSHYLEKNLENLIACVDDLMFEQNKFAKYQRELTKSAKSQRQDREVEEPSKLDSLLILTQIGNQCNEVQKFAAEGIAKIQLAEQLYKPVAAGSANAPAAATTTTSS